MVSIFVRGLSGRSRCLDVDVNVSTVEQIKQQIEAVECIPAHIQGLVYQGRQLQDGQLLQSYDIGRDSTLHLVLRLRGGKGGFGALLRGQGRDGKGTTNFDACRDLSGRRVRHQTAEQKLAEWQAQAPQRELEQVALQHIKELARQQKREAREQVDVEAVQAAQKEAVERTQKAVQDALAAGAVASNGSKAGTATGTGAAAAAAGAAAGSKRKADGEGAPGSSKGADPPKKSKMLDCLVEDLSDVSSSEDEEEEEETDQEEAP